MREADVTCCQNMFVMHCTSIRKRHNLLPRSSNFRGYGCSKISICRCHCSRECSCGVVVRLFGHEKMYESTWQQRPCLKLLDFVKHHEENLSPVDYLKTAREAYIKTARLVTRYFCLIPLLEQMENHGDKHDSFDVPSWIPDTSSTPAVILCKKTVMISFAGPS